MELGNVINILNQPKTPQTSIMDLGKQLLENAKDGHTNKVHDLMCRGAPFTTDWLGKSALHMAAESNHYETCEVLLRAGISKDSRTKVDRTPLHLAVYNGHEQIAKLLLEQKCDVNAKDLFKHTPLHWAVEEDYPNLVKLLLKYGADPYAESKAKQTPMSIAGEMGFDDMMQMMSTYKYQSSVSMEEQQEATDALMHEMGTEHLDAFKHNDADLSQDSTSCEDSSSASINLQANLNNSHKQSHRNSTLDLLQDESADDTNNFLQSAYACGRQIIVTEFGKQMILKVQNSNANTNTSTTQTMSANSTLGKNGHIKQKPVGIIMTNSQTSPKVLTKSNIVKRITPEELTKLCGEGKVIKTVCPPNVLSNGTIRFPKYRFMSKIGNSDNSVQSVKVFNKPTIANSSSGPATITAAKKMVIKSEPPQLTNFATAKLNKTNIVSNVTTKIESADTKMVQIPMNEYLDLVKQISQMTELKERLARLEEHCEKTTGFTRLKTTSQH